MESLSKHQAGSCDKIQIEIFDHLDREEVCNGYQVFKYSS
jgi:hypothetical protein